MKKITPKDIKDCKQAQKAAVLLRSEKCQRVTAYTGGLNGLGGSIKHHKAQSEMYEVAGDKLMVEFSNAIHRGDCAEALSLFERTSHFYGRERAHYGEVATQDITAKEKRREIMYALMVGHCLRSKG